MSNTASQGRNRFTFRLDLHSGVPVYRQLIDQVMGGIAAGSRDLLLKPLENRLDEFEWRPGGHRVRLGIAALGEWAGAHGAAWNVANPDRAA